MSCDCCTGPLSTQTCPILQCCGGQSCVVPGTCTADGGDDGEDGGGPGGSDSITNAKLLKPDYTGEIATQYDGIAISEDDYTTVNFIKNKLNFLYT